MTGEAVSPLSNSSRRPGRRRRRPLLLLALVPVAAWHLRGRGLPGPYRAVDDGAEEVDDELARLPNRTYFYSRLRGDRSGSVVQDMLMAHAAAFRRGMRYAGACQVLGTGVNPRSALVADLLEGLGLSGEIGLACPEDRNATTNPQIVERLAFARPGLAVFTPDWLAYMHGRVRYPDESPPGARRRAVVHVRRGDVQPCKDPKGRYAPSAYYRRVIEELIPLDHEVVVHSESHAFESWDDFRPAGRDDLRLRLNAPLLEVWRDMMTADLFVMGTSSFSVVPAVLNRRGRVLYTPFWYAPLPHWEVITGINSTDGLSELKAQRCP